MHKQDSVPVSTFVGIDVSARELTVAIGKGEGHEPITRFANDRSGHKQLLQRLQPFKGRVRVCLEASGNYSLDVCMVLQACSQIELWVVNPRQARRYAESLNTRSKTDPVDARVLCSYAARMSCQPWVPPSAEALKLRGLARAMASLTQVLIQAKNRRHAAGAADSLPRVVEKEFERIQHYLERRLEHLGREAVRVIGRNAELLRRFRLLQTTPGVGELSAIRVLAELVVLPEALDARQWVAYSGLDPSQHQSGTSVAAAPHISKLGNRHLRHALYMPALVAIQHESYLRGFYARLLAHGKAPMQAITAVMRKLLHAFHAMIGSDQPYDGARLCPAQATNA